MSRFKGFSIVELMIVVAIIGILSLMALPFYNNYIIKVKLTEKIQMHMHLLNAIELEINTEDPKTYIASLCSNTPSDNTGKDFNTMTCKTDTGLFPNSDLTLFHSSTNDSFTLEIIKKGASPNDYGITIAQFMNDRGTEGFTLIRSSIRFRSNSISTGEYFFGFAKISLDTDMSESMAVAIDRSIYGVDISPDVDGWDIKPINPNKWYCASKQKGDDDWLSNEFIFATLPRSLSPTLCLKDGFLYFRNYGSSSV